MHHTARLWKFTSPLKHCEKLFHFSWVIIYLGFRVVIKTCKINEITSISKLTFETTKVSSIKPIMLVQERDEEKSTYLLINFEVKCNSIWVSILKYMIIIFIFFRVHHFWTVSKASSCLKCTIETFYCDYH